MWGGVCERNRTSKARLCPGVLHHLLLNSACASCKEWNYVCSIDIHSLEQTIHVACRGQNTKAVQQPPVADAAQNGQAKTTHQYTHSTHDSKRQVVFVTNASHPAPSPAAAADGQARPEPVLIARRHKHVCKCSLGADAVWKGLPAPAVLFCLFSSQRQAVKCPTGITSRHRLSPDVRQPNTGRHCKQIPSQTLHRFAASACCTNKQSIPMTSDGSRPPPKPNMSCTATRAVAAAHSASVGGSNLLRSNVKVLLQFWSRSRHTPTSASACTFTHKVTQQQQSAYGA